MRGFRIFRIFGIDVSINPSWFIILFLIVWSLGAGFFPTVYLGWTGVEYWVVAVVAALMLFASLLAHELAHSLVARRQGTPVKGITLFLLGGVSNLEREAETPGREATMAAAGPATSVVLGVAFLALAQAVEEPQTVHALFTYLGVINLALAAFNLLPGFPLDGGRLLRSALWKLRGDIVWATRGATGVSVVVGLGLIGLGVVLLLGGSFVSGLWLGFIGWIIMQSAQSSYQQTLMQHALANVRADRVMTRPKGYVPAGTTLRDAVEDYFLRLDARCLPVGDEQRFEGIVCLTDMQRRERDSWSTDTVRDVMVGRQDIASITPDTAAAEALLMMAGKDINQLAVVADDRLVGFVDRGRLLRHATLLQGGDGVDGHDRRGRDEPDQEQRAA